MLKTEIYDGICLIMVKSNENNMKCLKIIKEELRKRKIKIFYSSASSFFSNGEKVVIAISENDVYPMLSTLGYIRETAGIINYSLNCSNSMITREGTGQDASELPHETLKDVKLISECEKYGIIICESDKKHKIMARLNSKK